MLQNLVWRLFSMALIFCDSFDHYQSADITRKWTALAFATIVAAAGRRSTACLRCTGGSQTVQKTVPAQTTYGVGVAILRSTNVAAGTIFQFMEGSTVHVIIRAEPGGFVAAYRGNTSTLVDTDAFGTISRIVQGQYCYMEAKVFVHDSTGTVEVRINGEIVLNLSSKDTANGGTPTINNIQLAGAADFDDLVIWDILTGNNDDFFGDVEIEHILPDGAGNATQWSTLVGAATHWQAVDESPAIDDDTSYVETATNTHLDQFTYANLSSITGGSTVLGVQVNTQAKVDSGSATIRAVARESAVDSNGSNVVLGTAWLNALEMWETNPNGGGAWTDTIINASEFGFEKVA
jgi:hypothetical protein